jgi:5-(carboxyamino)imidazole ribonucleotide synthase
VLSFEIEHVNSEKLNQLHRSGVQVIPRPSVLSIIQDKGKQKEFYVENNIETLDFELCKTEDLAERISHWSDNRFVLKHRKGGYDGKGVQVLSKEQFATLNAKKDPSLVSDSGFVIEAFLDSPKELSGIVAVDQNGNSTCYEISEMVFDPESNLMDFLACPAEISEEVSANAKDLAMRVVQAFDSPGLFAVEMFLTAENQLFVNEIAPRPHNSGHHTIESTICSQYEQLNRILLGWPLGSTKQVSVAISSNFVGPKDVVGEYKIENLDELLKIEGLYLHAYGKKDTKPFRKLGHYTILGASIAECKEKLNKAKELLLIKSK